MKKILAILLLSVVTATCYAGDKLKLVSGDVSSFKNGGTATVVIDFTNTTYDKKKPLRKDTRYTNIDNLIPNFTEEFVREFNENSKKFQLMESGNAEYKMTVVVDDLDYHVNVMSFKGAHATELEGTITFTKDGETVAKINFEHESTSVTFDLSIEETLEGLAKNLAKKLSKGKI